MIALYLPTYFESLSQSGCSYQIAESGSKFTRYGKLMPSSLFSFWARKKCKRMPLRFAIQNLVSLKNATEEITFSDTDGRVFCIRFMPCQQAADEAE